MRELEEVQRISMKDAQKKKKLSSRLSNDNNKDGNRVSPIKDMNEQGNQKKPSLFASLCSCFKKSS
jgi:hypothetical protein